MEPLITEDGNYRIESMSAATFPGALRVMKEAFHQYESICVGTEVNKDPQASEELLELAADAALDGVSLVAVHVITGEVAAVAFNRLVSNSTENTFFDTFYKERCNRPSARATSQFVIDLEEKCRLFDIYNVDCCFEHMYMATLPEHTRKGLGKLLCKMSIEAAKKLKYGLVAPMTVEDLGPKYAFLLSRKPIIKVPKVCYALWTAIGTQKIGKQLGFIRLERVSLKDYFYNGKSFAERIGFDPYCEVGALRIDSM